MGRRPNRDRNISERERRDKAVQVTSEGKSVKKVGGLILSNALPKPKWVEIKKRTGNTHLGH